VFPLISAHGRVFGPPQGSRYTIEPIRIRLVRAATAASQELMLGAVSSGVR
jgi:hypothetical protein